MQVRQALAKLEDKDLVSRSADRPATFVPVRPDVAMEVLIRAKREELAEAERASKLVVVRSGALTPLRTRSLRAGDA